MTGKDLEILTEINENLKILNKKIDRLIELQEKLRVNLTSSSGVLRTDLLKPIDAIDLLNLPDRLRKIASLMVEFNRATADQIASHESIKSTRESASERLNELVTLGYLAKERGRKEDGENPRKTYFYTFTEKEEPEED
ncbi:MAG: hypothetical protein ACTSRW_14025 [Candidatus Helarchaeota archaeon]